MPGKKKKILLVHSQLVQHGSERYLFEISKALNKDLFEVHILTRFFLIRRNYYYPKLIELGCQIHTRLLSIRHLRYPFKKIYNRYSIVRKALKLIHSSLLELLYFNFFDDFDLIAVIGIETYCDALSPILDDHKNVVIHHVTHDFQFERNYFNELKQNKIIICDNKQAIEVENSGIQDAETYFMPLPMVFDQDLKINRKSTLIKKTIRIAVFSRLFKDRPNEPLFRGFAAFKEKYPNAELLFYGSGDPIQYKELLNELNLNSSVFFKGHSTSIINSINQDHIDIIWLVSMGKSISYSSIETAQLGMPMVFWNLDDSDSLTIKQETEGAINSFNKIEDFVDFNLSIVIDQSKLNEVGSRLREYVKNYYDIQKNIKQLQDYYIEKSKLKSITTKKTLIKI